MFGVIGLSLIAVVFLVRDAGQGANSDPEAPVIHASQLDQDATGASMKAPIRSIPGSDSTRTLLWADTIEAEVDPTVVTDAGFRAAIKATGLPWRVRDKGTNIEMLLIPPGEFVMGWSKGLGDGYPIDQLPTEYRDLARHYNVSFQNTSDELPAHEVKLSKAFYLGRYEVTQQQYMSIKGDDPSYPSHLAKPTVSKVADLMAKGATKREAETEVSISEARLRSWIAENPPAESASGKEFPVNNVSWDDCAAFCKQTGLRLPSEAEWEYACRAGTRTPTYGPLGDIAHYRDFSKEAYHELGPQVVGDTLGERHTVGTKRANALGLHDMLGNVEEWVSDFYGPYNAEPQTDPAGPSNCAPNPSGVAGRVYRGGQSYFQPDSAFSASYRRASWQPKFALGFRVARTP